MVKSMIVERAKECEFCVRVFAMIKPLIGLRKLAYYLYDVARTAKYMSWWGGVSDEKYQLSAQLLFYYHKIEKGICLPGEKRIFALNVIPRIEDMLGRWLARGFPVDDPVYMGAVNSLVAYVDLLEKKDLDPKDVISSRVKAIIARSKVALDSPADTPLSIDSVAIGSDESLAVLKNLFEFRRSYRAFSDSPVPQLVIDEAMAMAQLSPSACNRQPCKAYVLTGMELKKRALRLQNGNAGFGHLAANVLVVTADMLGFFDASERNQPYVDGGLFSMSLIYALQAQGVVSCCLNWCASPANDKALHKLLDIPNSECVIMMIAIGYPPEHSLVPRSHRRLTSQVVNYVG